MDNTFVETILERVATWPDEAQAELMQSIIDIEVKHFGRYRLSDDERAAIREGIAQADRGEFVPDEVMSDFFKRHSR
jgi:predicted transcriptional regulator